MSEENEINTYDMLAYYAKLMREDYIPKKALREWCEKNHWDDFICPEIKLLNMTKLLDQFCKEGES